jgi:hypothetical protein
MPSVRLLFNFLDAVLDLAAFGFSFRQLVICRRTNQLLAQAR